MVTSLYKPLPGGASHTSFLFKIILIFSLMSIFASAAVAQMVRYRKVNQAPHVQILGNFCWLGGYRVHNFSVQGLEGLQLCTVSFQSISGCFSEELLPLLESVPYWSGN